MSTPSNINLKGDWVIFEDTTSPAISPVDLINMGVGTIRQLPYTYGAYSVDDIVAYKKEGTLYFTQSDVLFGTINENQILFVLTPAP